MLSILVPPTPEVTPGTNPGTTPGTNPGTNPGTTPGTNPGSPVVPNSNHNGANAGTGSLSGLPHTGSGSPQPESTTPNTEQAPSTQWYEGPIITGG